MQEAAQKFRRYVCNVERDIEILVLEMLDLIDSKTRTLRKLMKLHQNVRRVSRITSDQAVLFSGKRNATEKSNSSPSLTSNGNSLTENITITESTPYHAEVSEEANGEKNIEEKDVGKDTDEPVVAYIEDIAKAATGIEDSPEENWAEALTRSRPELPHLHNSSYSSMPSRSMIVNLEGALNNLEGCRPGHQGGVYLDLSVYRNVISTLKTAIARYGMMCSSSDLQESGLKLVGMGRSSTQPVLNVNVEEVVRRKTCSSTGCDKHARKKRC